MTAADARAVSGASLEPRPHPWNRGFRWHDHTGPFRALGDDQVRHYDRHGYVVVPDLVPADLLAEVTAAVDPFDARTEAFLRSAEGERLSIAEAGAITFSVHLATRSPVLRRLVTDAALTGIAADLVGPDVRLYWDQAVYKKPEKPRRFPWHQDNGYAYVEPQQYLTIWLALTDATTVNGCPQVVPGIHRGGEPSSTTTSSRWGGSASTSPGPPSPRPWPPAVRWCSRR